MSSRTFFFLLFSPFFPPKAHERHGKEQLDAKARLLERHVEEQQDVFHPPPGRTSEMPKSRSTIVLFTPPPAPACREARESRFALCVS